MKMDYRTKPALYQLLYNNYDDFICPFYCDVCSFGEIRDKPNTGNEAENYYKCHLTGLTVWGENPKCKASDWRQEAVNELENS